MYGVSVMRSRTLTGEVHFGAAALRTVKVSLSHLLVHDVFGLNSGWMSQLLLVRHLQYDTVQHRQTWIDGLINSSAH